MCAYITFNYKCVCMGSINCDTIGNRGQTIVAWEKLIILKWK